jgi:hypothetical protein
MFGGLLATERTGARQGARRLAVHESLPKERLLAAPSTTELRIMLLTAKSGKKVKYRSCCVWSLTPKHESGGSGIESEIKELSACVTFMNWGGKRRA